MSFAQARSEPEIPLFRAIYAGDMAVGFFILEDDTLTVSYVSATFWVFESLVLNAHSSNCRPIPIFCYAGDRDEPPHVHVERDKDEAKFWLQPIRLQNNRGFSRIEINRIQKLAEEHQEQLLAGWDEFFND